MAQNDNQQQENRAFKKEDAYETLGIINTWIGNMDTKVSFALALAGVLIGVIFEKACPDSCASLSAFHPMNLFLFLIIPAKTDCYNRFYIPSKWSWLFNQKQRMCLGTFSRLRRSLATSTLYVAVALPRKVFYFTGRNFL